MTTGSNGYLGLADRLAARIARSGADARLPSEHELEREHKVSRLTARAALEELERRHLVRRVRGRGTFVAPRLDYPIGPDMPPSWTEMVRRAGRRPRFEVMGIRVQRASAGSRQALALREGARVVVLRRRGVIDDLAASVSVSYLPVELVPDLKARLGSSLYATLRGAYGLEPVRAWCRAELEVMPPEANRALGLEGRPLGWSIESCNHCARSGRPVEVSHGWLRADVFRVRFELGSSR